MIESLNGVMRRGLMLLGVLCFAITMMVSPINALGKANRRIGIGIFPNFFILDSDYFGLENAPGIDIRIRYELEWNIYFENRLGYLFSEGNGTSVGGFSYQLGVTAILPYLIPYRPIANLGIGFLSADPITVTPTDTFRPSQTTFYFIGGAGLTRSIKENITVEAMVNVWTSPYRYRIYRFNRSTVEIDEKQFTHVSFHLGVSYIF
ncbi:MAG TPA: hypothetical protein VMX58_07955 [Patescibacteria group bacterium]|nr:hypothetical protein [Patescibacteria group bacterium]